MSEMTIYIATQNEIDKMTKSRVDYCLRNNSGLSKQEYELFYQQVNDWVVKKVERNEFITYFGQVGDEIISFAGVLMFSLPPIIGQIKRRQGYVLSFFTYPKHRNQGYGKKLMEYMKKDAVNHGIDDLVLKATSDGENLYRKCGFSEPKMPYMEYKITKN